VPTINTLGRDIFTHLARESGMDDNDSMNVIHMRDGTS
jgi:hypothetical protein